MQKDDVIYRQAAIEIVDYECGGQLIGTAKIITTRLSDLPPAQPEIIRCKDCEYYHPYYCEVWSKFGIIQTRENGYCYMAERREE